MTPPLCTCATDAAYALDLCDRIAAHTDVPGTIERLFLSPATRQVQALLRQEMEALGMTVRLDSAGNLRGLYPAASPQSPVLLMGSHLDTVPNAGRYDGLLGIALALATVRSLEGHKLAYAIEIIAFSEEEGVRFRLPFLGSRALIGTLDAETLSRADKQGITLDQALRAYGLNPATLADAALTPGTFAFLEMHIEQGPVLESLGLPLGIVTTIIGQSRLACTFTGQANHAGTTPMHLRRDALAAAAEFIGNIETFAQTTSDLVATVGTISASPGAANIIPGTCTFSLDLRHADDNARRASVAALLAVAHQIAADRNITFTSVETSQQAAVPMDPNLEVALALALKATKNPVYVMPSGAGHDAMIVASAVPTAMLFLRTPGGLSHHPDEAVSEHDVEAALATCLHLLQNLNPAAITKGAQP